MTGLPGGSADVHCGVDRGLRRSWAACSRAFRRSCCSGRCCSRLRGPSGVHEVHYAMIVILAMGIGLFAPPFGVGYYAACAIGRVDPAEGIAADLGLPVGADGRPDYRGDLPVDFHRVLVKI